MSGVSMDQISVSRLKKDVVDEVLHNDQRQVIKLSKIVYGMMCVVEAVLNSNVVSGKLVDKGREYSNNMESLKELKEQLFNEFSITNIDADKKLVQNTKVEPSEGKIEPSEEENKGKQDSHLEQLSEQFLMNINGLNANLQNLENYLVENHNQQVENIKLDADRNENNNEKDDKNITRSISINHILNDSFSDGNSDSSSQSQSKNAYSSSNLFDFLNNTSTSKSNNTGDLNKLAVTKNTTHDNDTNDFTIGLTSFALLLNDGVMDNSFLDPCKNKNSTSTSKSNNTGDLDKFAVTKNTIRDNDTNSFTLPPLQELERPVLKRKHEPSSLEKDRKSLKISSIIEQNSDKNKKPIYTFAKLDTIKDVLTEYFYGINNGPAVIKLEMEYGARWRGGHKHSVSKMYQRRKNLYNAVERAIFSKECPLEFDSCVELLEKHRTFANGPLDKNNSTNSCQIQKKSIHWVTSNLPKELLLFLSESELKVHNNSREHEK